VNTGTADIPGPQKRGTGGTGIGATHRRMPFSMVIMLVGFAKYDSRKF